MNVNVNLNLNVNFQDSKYFYNTDSGNEQVDNDPMQ